MHHQSTYHVRLSITDEQTGRLLSFECEEIEPPNDETADEYLAELYVRKIQCGHEHPAWAELKAEIVRTTQHPVFGGDEEITDSSEGRRLLWDGASW